MARLSQLMPATFGASSVRNFSTGEEKAGENDLGVSFFFVAKMKNGPWTKCKCTTLTSEMNSKFEYVTILV